MVGNEKVPGRESNGNGRIRFDTKTVTTRRRFVQVKWKWNWRLIVVLLALIGALLTVILVQNLTSNLPPWVHD